MTQLSDQLKQTIVCTTFAVLHTQAEEGEQVYVREGFHYVQTMIASKFHRTHRSLAIVGILLCQGQVLDCSLLVIVGIHRCLVIYSHPNLRSIHCCLQQSFPRSRLINNTTISKILLVNMKPITIKLRQVTAS